LRKAAVPPAGTPLSLLRGPTRDGSRRPDGPRNRAWPGSPQPVRRR